MKTRAALLLVILLLIFAGGLALEFFLEGKPAPAAKPDAPKVADALKPSSVTTVTATVEAPKAKPVPASGDPLPNPPDLRPQEVVQPPIQQPSLPPLSDFGRVAVTDGVSFTRTLVTGEVCTVTPHIIGEGEASQIQLEMEIADGSGSKFSAPKITALRDSTVSIMVGGSGNSPGIRMQITPYIEGLPPPPSQ